MLSMKTLRVAIVTMGSALLLGSGFAVAQDPTLANLNPGPTETPFTPLMYAQETLPAQADNQGRRGFTLATPGIDVVVKPRRAIDASEEEVYLRIDLSGAQFSATPTVVTYSAPDENNNGARTTAVDSSPATSLSSGGANNSYAVVRLTIDAASQGYLGVRIAGSGDAGSTDLYATTTSGNVTATIAAYTDPDDALDEVGSRSTFSGSATLVRFVSGLKVSLGAADDAVASVATGFMRFAGPPATNGQARLGWLGIEEISMPGMDAPEVRNANDGAQIDRGDILSTGPNDDEGNPTPVGLISFNVMGNLDIGAFNLKMETFEGEGGETPANATGTCDAVGEGQVDQGDLVDAESMKLIGEEGELPSGVTAASTGMIAPDVYLLCVNVDVTGPGSNMNPIPEGEYAATAHYKRDAGVNTPVQMAGEETTVGVIDRDGASVEIPYLTTSAKHNQRIIIVNRGTAPVPITGIEFTTEDGTDAELMGPVQALLDNGMLEVPGNSSWVARMDETVSITGDSKRTAATINFFGVRDNLSVATTQVNVSDGSTDTVVYMIDE